MKIQKLSEKAILKLQSGLVITDAVQCVLELVQNSLDAEATGIAVRIDFKNFQIQVIDNGKGIGRDDFELVGEKYMTSKFRIHDTDSIFPIYGFKGQALSSLLHVCKSLTIETKSEDDGPTFVKVFQNKKASAITEANSERRGTGTTVTVKDFMYSMPVRRRRINEMFDIEEIKNQLQYLAIIHYNVCFTLRNENKGVILLQTSQASNTLEAISNIFGKTVAKSLTALCYKEKICSITGFISLKPQFQSNIQLLYVNKRLVTKGVTHRFINNVIKQYVKKNILCADSPSAQVLKSLKNCCYNIYIIEIQCPYSHYELITNVRKTTVEFRNWKDILKNLHKAIRKTFKEVLNLDSSSNIKDNDSNNGTATNVTKRKFGTSVLMNAVKGDPVKRKLTSKREGKQKAKQRLNQMLNDSPTSESKNKKKMVNQTSRDCSYQREISYDSLESPIPKNHLKRFKSDSEVKSTKTFNQSFLEFYEWVKGKIETDSNALNLYNDFMQFKNGINKSILLADAEFKSPVVGGKLKRKKMESPEKIKKKQERKPNKSFCLSALNEEIAIMTRQQTKIFPSNRLRMKKAVQFNTQNSINLFENSNFGFVQNEKTSLFKGLFDVPNSSKEDPKHNNSFLPSSERQLNNIIKFRNQSESFFQQESIDIHSEIPLDYNYGSASGSWASHYQDIMLRNVEFNEQRRSVTAIPLHKKNVIRSKNAEQFILEGNRVNEKSGSTDITKQKGEKAVHDVEIQVNLSKRKPRRENAVILTSLTDSIIPETLSFKTADVMNQGIRNILPKNAGVEQINELETSIKSQEVANADFLNISAQSCHYNSLQLFGNPNEIIKDSQSAIMNEKNSTSSEFLCGQKSNSCIKPQIETSTSKKTQTLANIWGNSLTEITKASIATDSNLISESTLPKTIPVEEIDYNMLQVTESVFSLTERHDFIPKGLSPTFFTTESCKIFNLSPGEKCKLKLTLESAKEDLLATVKWQDDFTGDYVKPVFPDKILDEMSLRAGKSIINFENQVLSASLSYCAIKVHNLLHSFAFTKELLAGVEILGQLDKKFIVTRMKLSTPKKMELITLFDQHAVDERIKLEKLIRDYSSSDGKFIASRLNPSVECVLNKSDVRIVSDSNEKLLNFGLNVKAIDENTVCFTEIPTFLLNKHEKDVKNKKDVSLSNVLKALIKDIMEEMRETRGALSKIPKIIHNAFCLEACHKAIKFNRGLSIENMTEMINNLKCCKLPFQCAHGRPSVIPIIDLEDFQPLMKENEAVVLEKIKKFRNQLNLGKIPGSLSTA